MDNRDIRYRAFTAKFCEHMATGNPNEWPTFDRLAEWFVNSPRGQSFKNARYSKMKKGLSDKEEYFHDLIRMLVTRGMARNAPHYYEATVRFLQSRGLSQQQMDDMEAVMNVLCTPPTPIPVVSSGIIDYLQLGFRGLQQIFEFETADRCAQLMPVKRVPEAIAWMFIDYGRQLALPRQVTTKEAIELTEQMMHLTLEDYQARAVRWRAQNPWTIVGFRGDDKMLGMSLALPVSAEARAEVLDGNQMTYDCTHSQIRQHSRFLIHEGFAIRPVEMHGDPSSALIQPYFAVLAQAAALSDFRKLRADTPLTILSTPGTPINRDRLDGFGYKPTGKHMRLTNIEFVQLVIKRHISDGFGAFFLDFLSRQIRDMPPYP